MAKRLPKTVNELLDKAQDSALQAISTYNDPRSSFRTGNFAVLMIIAWTSLMHAYLEFKKVKYFYKLPNGRYKYLDGDKMAWDLGKCIEELLDKNDPIRKNVELFIKLRNKIEHRNLPALDQETQGECQALVLNFESWLSENFGLDKSIINTMFVPIQLTASRKTLPRSKTEENVIKFIKDYRSLLSAEIEQSQQYQFKAFLVPKIGNHRSSSDIAIEFIRYDEANPEEMKKYDKAIVAIKERIVPVSNTDVYLPGIVLERIKRKTGKEVSMTWHTNMWRKYGVRPESNAINKTITKTDFCRYDAAHGDYQYTDTWIEMLIEKELNAGLTRE
jgi:hypothetical protein